MAERQRAIGAAIMGLILALPPSAAGAESRLQLTSSLSLLASDNPLLRPGGTSALMAEATINPSWSLQEATASTDLSARFTVRRYSREYDKYTYGGVDLKRQGSLSEALSYSGSLAYDRSVTVDVIDDVAAAIDPTSLRNQFSADGSINWRPNARGQLSAGASYNRVWFDKAVVLNNYSAVGANLGYSHSFSEATRIGVQATLGLNRSAASTDTNVFGLMATIEYRLAELWTLTGGAGAERIRPVGRVPVAGNSIGGTFASGNVKLCRKGERTQLCASAALASQASGIGPVQRRLTLDTSLSYRLSERTDVTLGGTYQRPVGSSARAALGALAEPRYLQVRADLNRRVSETLTIGAYASYRRREGVAEVDAGYVGLNLQWKPNLR